MRVRTEIVALRTLDAGAERRLRRHLDGRAQSHIATIPMGYGDGLSRALSNQGHVLVRGKRAPIIGAISMDMTSST